MSVPYERIVQWAAGPIAIGAGYVATLAEAHLGVLNSIGLGGHSGEASIAKGIVVAATFAVGSLVTYAAHHKWLDNLPKFWSLLPAPAIAALANGATGALPVIEGKATETPDQIVAGIDAAEEAAKVIQSRPGTPANEVDHGLSPSPTALPGAPA